LLSVIEDLKESEYLPATLVYLTLPYRLKKRLLERRLVGRKPEVKNKKKLTQVGSIG